MQADSELMALFSTVLILLVGATCVALVLRRRARTAESRKFVGELTARVRAWWVMCAVFAIAILTGGVGSIVLFALVSFLALREFVTVVPTARSDHGALFWTFFFIVPSQYFLVWLGWYGLFVLFIPVYAFLFLPARMALGGECRGFLERAAKVQWGLMACVYCVSHAPAILNLTIPGFEGQGPKLLLFFVMVVELCDVAQYVWGKAFGRRKIVPTVSPNKTWEGFLGGWLTAGLVGAALSWATPFSVFEAFAMALGVGALGFVGDIVMSAIKRDSNLKDYGELIPGHGGMLDRIDSLCFAAPFFFHMTRFFYGGSVPAPF